MKILFLVHRLPFPPDRGDRLRSFNIIRGLSEKHDVKVFCVTEGEPDRVCISELLRYCSGVDAVAVVPFFKKSTFFVPLLTGRSMTEHYFCSRRLAGKVERALNGEHFDCIYVYSSSMAQYVPDTFRGAVIMDFIDADSDKWGQYARAGPLPLRVVYRREGKIIGKLEQRLLSRADVSLVVSGADKKILHTSNPEARIEVLRNGVDTGYFAPAGRNSKSGVPAIVFTGMMDYFPNTDGVVYFMHRVWPLIKKQVPDVVFYIVGKSPPRRIRIFGKEKDVYVTGYVPDIRDYLTKAWVSVVPLRIARGIQNKILEAMACGVPVVSTEVAAEGVPYSAEEGVLVSSDDVAFAGHVYRLLCNRAVRERLSAKASAAVRDTAGWERALSKLEKILRNTTRTERMF